MRNAWISARGQEVLAEAEGFALSLAVSDSQRELLRTGLVGLHAQVKSWNPPGRKDQAVLPPFIYLPLFVCAGLCGDDRPAIPLAAATSLLFLGLDIFDDVADGDCPAHWNGHSPTDMNLLAATLLCSIPQLIIANLKASPYQLCAMQRSLAAGLLRMSAGQQRDISSAGAENFGVNDTIFTVASKSGEEVGMFALLAAQLARATVEQSHAYTEFGRAIGTAGQLASDCYELFNDWAARDFAHGARTLPVALYLERLKRDERPNFLALLERARYDEASRTEVRKSLRGAGVLRLCAFIVETYCQRARRSLAEAAPLEPAYEGLRMMIDGITFFPKGESQ